MSTVGAVGRGFADTVVRPLVLDAGGEVLRRALRVAVLGTLAFVVIGRVLGYETQAGTAVFAVVALDGFADFSGTPARRFTRHLGVGLVAAAAFPLAELVRPYPWVLLVVTALITFSTYFAGVLGGPFFAARFPIMIAFLFAATAPGDRAMLVEDLTGWVLGTVAAAVGSVVLWPAHRRFPVRSLVAELCSSVAASVGSRSSPGADELLETVAQLRSVTVARRLRTGTLATPDRILAEVVHQSERLVASLVTLGTGPDGRLRQLQEPADRALFDQLARTLHAVAVTIAEPRRAAVRLDPLPVGALRDAIAAHVAACRERLEAPDADPADVDAVASSADARIVAVAGLLLAELVESWRRGSTAAGGPAAAALTGSGPIDSFRRHATLNSLWLRNSLRAAVACTAAVGLVELGVGSGRGFWLTLATISVLRADLATISRSVASAVAGTAVGFGLSAVLLTVAGDWEPVLWLILPFLLFLLAANGGVHPLVSTASFTTFVVVTVTISDPAFIDAGRVRLLNAVIGGALALVVTAILWPRIGSVPEGSIAEVLRRLAHGLRSVGHVADRRRAGPTSTPKWSDTVACLVDLDRVFDMITTSAPRALPGTLRARLLVFSEISVAVTAILGGFAARVGAVPLDTPAGDWDDAAARAARSDLDCAADVLDALADRITHPTAGPAAGVADHPSPSATPSASPSATMALARSRTGRPVDHLTRVVDLVRVGGGLEQIVRIAARAPAVRHGREITRVA